MSTCVFSDPALQAQCEATAAALAAAEEARAAARAAQAQLDAQAAALAAAVEEVTAAADMSLHQRLLEWGELLVSAAPWLALIYIVYAFSPAIAELLARPKVNVTIGNVELSAQEFAEASRETAIELSYDLMDVSAVLDAAPVFPDWDRFKPEFDAGGRTLLKAGKFLEGPPGSEIAFGDKQDTRAERQLHILWIDDEQRLADYRVAFLRRRGYSVRPATSTKAALAALQDETFDVVVTDTTRVDDNGRSNPAAWVSVYNALRAEDVRDGRAGPTLTPFIISTSPAKAIELMADRPGEAQRAIRTFRGDARAFATFSFSLIRDRLLWLERHPSDDASTQAVR